MRGKWTEGEWRLAEHVTKTGAGWGFSREVWGNSNGAIAAAFVSGHGDEFDANARLIAAAPALYEALANTSALLRLYKGNLDPDVNEVLAAAEAALSLAHPPANHTKTEESDAGQ